MWQSRHVTLKATSDDNGNKPRQHLSAHIWTLEASEKTFFIMLHTC